MDPAIRRQSLADILHRSAARAPHKPAVLCGSVRWTQHGKPLGVVGDDQLEAGDGTDRAPWGGGEVRSTAEAG
jgi:hypothetical protein